MKELNINITGDFIDSFIYSGVLFTVDTDGRLCSYSWNHLVERYFSLHPEYSFMKSKILDCRNRKNNPITENITLNFEKSFLEKYQKGTCCDLDVWSTDLDVKDNILYISSERGLETLPFLEEWDNGKIMKFNELVPLWKEAKVFGLSTGSWGRTILAAGDNGALEIMNNDVEQLKNIGFSRKKEKIINDSICLDCEWNSNSTLAILEGLGDKIVYLFNKITSDSNFKSTSKNNLVSEEKEKSIRKITDILNNEEVKNISRIEFNNSWFEEGKLYAAGEGNKEYMFKNNRWIELSDSTLDLSRTVISKVKKINSGRFIETDSDELFRVKDRREHLLSDDYTSWRVFPRSKNYQDRIHIVNDDYLQIKIFD
ncbi:hypothetical protein WLQ65_01830 [Pseudoalteromonas piscicida]|uniref:hypothetical protein n=1 Tax=Pseudoalteromonas piscicida TaxID=43662 RepID=UPI0030C9CB59